MVTTLLGISDKCTFACSVNTVTVHMCKSFWNPSVWGWFCHDAKIKRALFFFCLITGTSTTTTW